MATVATTDASMTLRALLRLRTERLHHRLDRAPALAALLRPGLDERAYAAVLTRFAGIHEALEPALARLEGARPEGLPPYRSRSQALREELAGLPAQPWPASPAPLLLTGWAAPGLYLGLRYVLDGATQGARVIYPRLLRALPHRPPAAFAFWHRQQSASADWPALCACLARESASAAEADAALFGAEAAFGVFIAVFESRGDAL